MGSFFGALGALGSGIRQAKQQRLDEEQLQLGKLYQLFQLNEQRKGEARQDWLDRANELQRAGAEPSDQDLEIKHRYDSARHYGENLVDQIATNIGGPKGKSAVGGVLKPIVKAFGIDHKEELPDIGGGFGAGGSSSASPQSVEASSSAAPPASMESGGPPPSILQSDSLPSAQVSPIAARFARSWQDPLNDARAPAGLVFTPGSVGGPPGRTTEGPTPAAPFAFSRYPEPMGPADIARQTYRRYGGLGIPRTQMETNIADQQRFHADQLLGMLGDYVQYVHANEKPGETPKFSEAMKDPRFAQLEGALRQAQAAKIYVNGKPEDLLRPGAIHDALKSHFSDYERPEDRGKKNVEQQLEEAAMPGYNELAVNGGRTDLLNPKLAQAVNAHERFQRSKGGDPLKAYFQSLLDRKVPVEKAMQMTENIQAGRYAFAPERVVTIGPDGKLAWETGPRGFTPKNPPPEKKPTFDSNKFMAMTPAREEFFLLPPEQKARFKALGLGPHEKYLDLNKVKLASEAGEIPLDVLNNWIAASPYEPEKRKLQEIYNKQLMSQYMKTPAK